MLLVIYIQLTWLRFETQCIWTSCDSSHLERNFLGAFNFSYHTSATPELLYVAVCDPCTTRWAGGEDKLQCWR